MRGDRPWFPGTELRHVQFTPHARGSTYTLSAMVSRLQVYPACAGIDREVLPTDRN